MQTNFEIVKTAIYQHVVSLPEFNFCLLGVEFKYYHLKREEAKRKLNELLDRMDIRSVSKVLNNHKGIRVPKWIRNNEFVIDYNSKNELDLIRIKQFSYE